MARTCGDCTYQKQRVELVTLLCTFSNLIYKCGLMAVITVRAGTAR